MSESASEDPSTGTQRRTVTGSYFGQPNAEMDAVGWAMFVVMLVVVLPLAPFVLVGWIAWKLATSLAGERGSESVS